MSSQYAQTSDIVAIGMPADALDGISDYNPYLITASGFIDSYLRSGYSVPLVFVPDEIKRATVIVAVYDMICFRGFDPEQSIDQVIRQRYEDLVGRPGMVGWLKMLSDKSVLLDAGSDATPNVSQGAPIVASSCPRGWETNYI